MDQPYHLSMIAINGLYFLVNGCMVCISRDEKLGGPSKWYSYNQASHIKQNQGTAVGWRLLVSQLVYHMHVLYYHHAQH